MGLGGPERARYSDQCMLMEEPQTATRKGIETGERSQVFDTLKKKKKKKGSMMTRCFFKTSVGRGQQVHLCLLCAWQQDVMKGSVSCNQTLPHRSEGSPWPHRRQP